VFFEVPKKVDIRGVETIKKRSEKAVIQLPITEIKHGKNQGYAAHHSQTTKPRDQGISPFACFVRRLEFYFSVGFLEMASGTRRNRVARHDFHFLNEPDGSNV
jgi:hypothetical protein